VNPLKKPTSFQPASVITRRAFLPILITGVGAAGLTYSLVHWWRGMSIVPLSATEGPPRLQPRFRRNKVTYFLSKLDPGFYLNPKSQVIHYVGADKKVSAVKSVNESRLTPVKLDTTKQEPHVNRACASYVFELEALSLLHQNEVDKACELLSYAVGQDLSRLVIRDPIIGGERLNDRHRSLRLFDLLAGVSLRTSRKKYLDEMIRTIENELNRSKQNVVEKEQDRNTDAPELRSPGSTTALESRIKTWRDPKSNWHRRWSNTKKKIEWKADKVNGLVF
jgi:hypothetical protein